jgi:hypothetical protein
VIERQHKQCIEKFAGEIVVPWRQADQDGAYTHNQFAGSIVTAIGRVTLRLEMDNFWQ